MVHMLRLVLILMAGLFLAGGAMAFEMVAPHAGQDISHTRMTENPGKAHAGRGGRYCLETGCSAAACPAQCMILPMIVPDQPPCEPVRLPSRFRPFVEHGLISLFFAPPVPPPKSPIFEFFGGFPA